MKLSNKQINWLLVLAVLATVGWMMLANHYDGLRHNNEILVQQQK